MRFVFETPRFSAASAIVDGGSRQKGSFEYRTSFFIRNKAVEGRVKLMHVGCKRTDDGRKVIGDNPLKNTFLTLCSFASRFICDYPPLPSELLIRADNLPSFHHQGAIFMDDFGDGRLSNCAKTICDLKVWVFEVNLAWNYEVTYRGRGCWGLKPPSLRFLQELMWRLKRAALIEWACCKHSLERK